MHTWNKRSQRDMKSIINIKKLIHDYQKYNEDGRWSPPTGQWMR